MFAEYADYNLSRRMEMWEIEQFGRAAWTRSDERFLESVAASATKPSAGKATVATSAES